MTDITNIRPIRSNIKIEDVSPDQGVVEALEHLLSLARTGELREFVSLGICANNNILEYIEGEVYDPHYMQALIVHLSNRYYKEQFLPFFEGEEM